MSDEVVLFHDLAARLRADGTPQPVADLVLAAYRDDESLAAVLAGGELAAPGHAGPAGPVNGRTCGWTPSGSRVSAASDRRRS
jgi:hypothetical protein